MLCVLVTSISFFTASLATARDNAPHFDETHKIVGLLLIIILFLHIIAAVCRPDSGDHGIEKKSTTKRILWENAHRGVGVFLVFGSIFQMYTGIDMYEDKFGILDRSLYIALFGWIGILTIMNVYAAYKGFFYDKESGSEHTLTELGTIRDKENYDRENIPVGIEN